SSDASRQISLARGPCSTGSRARCSPRALPRPSDREEPSRAVEDIMKLLLVTSCDPWTRSVSTVHHYVTAGRALGHEVALFGPPNPDLPSLPYTTDLDGVDLALFIIQVPGDFPEMPHLARLIDTIPREKRAVVDLWGRYNETI